MAQIETLHRDFAQATHERVDQYLLIDVARLTGVSERRLRYWDRVGLVSPSQVGDKKKCYSFRDLVAIRVVKRLLDEGISLQRVRSNVQHVRQQFPHLSTPLACLRIYSEHMQLLVKEGSAVFDASTGQGLLNLLLHEQTPENQENIALLHPREGNFAVDENDTKTAFEWFQIGCTHEQAWNGEDPQDQAFIEACKAYDRALDLDPEFAAAYTNLGSLLAAIGDFDGARDHFDEALRCDAEQTEAQSNLASLALHSGDFSTAISGYRRVLKRVPEDAEAHYGLGRAFLATGANTKALIHLEKFCQFVACSSATKKHPNLVQRCEHANKLIARLREELG